MANNLTSNPLRIDTAATIVQSGKGIWVTLMQWGADDNAAGGNLTAGDNLVMTMNGVIVQYDCIIALSENITWQFSKPFFIESLVVNTIDGGTLYIWKTDV